MCFSSSSGIGGPPKTETPASSIVWFPLGFGDTSKFGSSSISNGWDLWQGFHSEPLWNLCLMCLPLDFGVPSTPCGFGGPLCFPRHSRTPSFLHQEAQNSAGPLLVYFASRLFSWGSEPLRGWDESRRGVEVRGRCGPHKQRHCTHHHRRHDERGPHMPSTAQEEATSVTDTDVTAKVGKWGTTGLPCAKDSGRMGRVCIFKDSCRRQESGAGVPGELRDPSSGRSSQCVE